MTSAAIEKLKSTEMVELSSVKKVLDRLKEEATGSVTYQAID